MRKQTMSSKVNDDGDDNNHNDGDDDEAVSIQYLPSVKYNKTHWIQIKL